MYTGYHLMGIPRHRGIVVSGPHRSKTQTTGARPVKCLGNVKSLRLKVGKMGSLGQFPFGREARAPDSTFPPMCVDVLLGKHAM